MLSNTLRQSLGTAVEQYQTEVHQVLPYLAARGISEETARTFRLGYVANPVVGDEQFTGRLAIPYDTPSGAVDVRFRAVGPMEPKYMSRAGATGHLYNVTALALDSDIIALCEGEMDTIVAHANCNIPALGVPGANAWKPHYARVLVDYDRIVLLCDGDQPGRDWGKRISQSLENAVVVSMPDGMDVNEVFLSEGPDAIRKRAGV
jgi:DNA primase